MYKGAKGAHCNVQRVTKNDQEQEPQPFSNVWRVSQYHYAHVVECHAKHASGKAKSVQTDVTEYVANKAGNHIVGIPKAHSDVGKLVAFGIVEHEYSKGGNYAQYNHDPLCERGVKNTGKRKCSHYDASNHKQGPSPGAKACVEALSPGFVDSLNYHCQADMHHTDHQGQNHSCVVAGYLRGQEYSLDGLEYLPLGDIDGEEGVEKESYHHGSKAQCNDKRGKVPDLFP